MELTNTKWDALLEDFYKNPKYIALWDFLDKEYGSQNIFPPRDEIFTSLKLVAPDEVRVVILGQDPYHGRGQAHGLAFSVCDGVEVPPSLRNIFKEIGNETGIKPPKSGNLTYLATQGILLLNAVLTVREGQAGSHRNMGWELFTDEIIKIISSRKKPVCFILWGNYAKAKIPLIGKQHKILTSAHPSPLSATGFFGNNHFNLVNEFLRVQGEEEILW